MPSQPSRALLSVLFVVVFSVAVAGCGRKGAPEPPPPENPPEDYKGNPKAPIEPARDSFILDKLI